MSIPFAVSIVEADAMCGREENAPQQRNAKSLHVVSGAQQKPTHRPVYNKAFGFRRYVAVSVQFQIGKRLCIHVGPRIFIRRPLALMTTEYETSAEYHSRINHPHDELGCRGPSCEHEYQFRSQFAVSIVKADAM